MGRVGEWLIEGTQKYVPQILEMQGVALLLWPTLHCSLKDWEKQACGVNIVAYVSELLRAESSP